MGQTCVEVPCVVCHQPFLTPPSGAGKRKTCSRKCAAELKRSRGGARRKGERNPNYRHGRRVGDRDREGERRWYAALGTRCSHPDCASDAHLVLHHVTYRQAVRRASGDEWDPRNAMTLCTSCHGHHQRGRVIPLTSLSAGALEFAVDLLGAGPAFEYLRRRYAGDDPRLESHLARC